MHWNPDESDPVAIEPHHLSLDHELAHFGWPPIVVALTHTGRREVSQKREKGRVYIGEMDHLVVER